MKLLIFFFYEQEELYPGDPSASQDRRDEVNLLQTACSSVSAGLGNAKYAPCFWSYAAWSPSRWICNNNINPFTVARLYSDRKGAETAELSYVLLSSTGIIISYLCCFYQQSTHNPNRNLQSCSDRETDTSLNVWCITKRIKEFGSSTKKVSSVPTAAAVVEMSTLAEIARTHTSSLSYFLKQQAKFHFHSLKITSFFFFFALIIQNLSNLSGLIILSHQP